ncbi:TadE/TadG family type IV pilus assembly protein [Aureimonas pseudogalii]|uniref:Flp pilus assembly protein TadG n=1 Tax=Aureimonas pseudogalii TaxID=1744844 RepID=A0A7W6EDZ7_9HYPH|nr:TadE/TadG family type IV pilus assembly protein [Aureimonas pseudogalii]MBB3997587.1 Flp pilus assembly protein TadG [Aureimonas pseudogalii]
MPLLFRLRNFLRFERGANIPIMAALLLIPMTLLAGGAVDFVGHEKIRVALQDALDRGVLAAAALNQSEDPRKVVMSYLRTVPGGATAELTLSEEKRTNYRKITAGAKVTYVPSFLQLADIRKLDVAAAATAQEARQNIELSLVLDISGSMLDNGGMKLLKPAAKSFLDTMLKPDVRPFTSVSIVPFAGQVSAGSKAIYQYLATPFYGLTPLHGRVIQEKTWCFELPSGDFAAGTPTFAFRKQVPHFSVYNISAAGKQPWWCPTDEAGITYPTNDVTYLKNRVELLRPFDGTGTAYGMKWGELLLNPSMQSSLKAIGDKGLAPIPEAFRSRPAAFDDKDTMKFIVLMTDGQIGFQPRPTNGEAEVTDRNIPQTNQIYTQSQSEALYKQVCAYTKKQGITIFTIAFAISDNSVANSIASCASQLGYAYRVDGLDMATAFRSIATTLQQIRLVK